MRLYNNLINEIKSTIAPDCRQLTVISDRQSAIFQELQNAPPGGIVLIAGKGHENYQEINGVKYHFDDREVVRDFIQNC